MSETDINIEPGLLDAYTGAEYVVFNDLMGPPVTVRIDQPNAKMASLLALHGVSEGFIVTPFNPHSERLSPDANVEQYPTCAACSGAICAGRSKATSCVRGEVPPPNGPSSASACSVPPVSRWLRWGGTSGRMLSSGLTGTVRLNWFC